jgi:hypothetical protein
MKRTSFGLHFWPVVGFGGDVERVPKRLMRENCWRFTY